MKFSIELLKGLHGFRNFKQSFFFSIFYIIVHVKNIFPKFQVYQSQILRERDF